MAVRVCVFACLRVCVCVLACVKSLTCWEEMDLAPLKRLGWLLRAGSDSARFFRAIPPPIIFAPDGADALGLFMSASRLTCPSAPRRLTGGAAAGCGCSSTARGRDAAGAAAGAAGLAAAGAGLAGAGVGTTTTGASTGFWEKRSSSTLAAILRAPRPGRPLLFRVAPRRLPGLRPDAGLAGLALGTALGTGLGAGAASGAGADATGASGSGSSCLRKSLTSLASSALYICAARLVYLPAEEEGWSSVQRAASVSAPSLGKERRGGGFRCTRLRFGLTLDVGARGTRCAETVLLEELLGTLVATRRLEDGELRVIPSVHVDGLHLRDVHPELAVRGGAVEADEDSETPRRPLGIGDTAIEAFLVVRLGEELPEERVTFQRLRNLAANHLERRHLAETGAGAKAARAISTRRPETRQGRPPPPPRVALNLLPYLLGDEETREPPLPSAEPLPPTPPTLDQHARVFKFKSEIVVCRS